MEEWAKTWLTDEVQAREVAVKRFSLSSLPCIVKMGTCTDIGDRFCRQGSGRVG